MPPFDLAETEFPWFNTAVGAISALAVFGILWGNRILATPILALCALGVRGQAKPMAPANPYGLDPFYAGFRRPKPRRRGAPRPGEPARIHSTDPASRALPATRRPPWVDG